MMLFSSVKEYRYPITIQSKVILNGSDLTKNIGQLLDGGVLKVESSLTVMFVRELDLDGS